MHRYTSPSRLPCWDEPWGGRFDLSVGRAQPVVAERHRLQPVNTHADTDPLGCRQQLEASASSCKRVTCRNVLFCRWSGGGVPALRRQARLLGHNLLSMPMSGSLTARRVPLMLSVRRTEGPASRSVAAHRAPSPDHGGYAMPLSALPPLAVPGFAEGSAGCGSAGRLGGDVAVHVVSPIPAAQDWR
jgi:hypothetical protein